MLFYGNMDAQRKKKVVEHMENYPIKSVAFGGFDKQDVVAYIQKTAQEATEAQTRLEQERDALQTQLDAANTKLAALRTRVAHLEQSEAALQTQLTETSAAKAHLEAQQSEMASLSARVEQLEAECAALRPDAEAYAQFREKIGAIECEARKRAADLEEETLTQLCRTVDLFRRQYQVLMSTFETTASHVNTELRKVEVNLTQLPRAMDQSGLELNELAARLQSKKED